MFKINKSKLTEEISLSDIQSMLENVKNLRKLQMKLLTWKSFAV